MGVPKRRSRTRARASAGATSRSACRSSRSARTATSRSCRTTSARTAAGTTAARRSSQAAASRPSGDDPRTAEAVTGRDASSRVGAAAPAGRPRRRRRDGRRPRPRRGRPGRPRLRPRRIPTTRSSSSATRPSIRPIAGDAARRTCAIVHASQVIGMDEHPALRPPREEGRLDPRRDGPRPARRGRRGRHRRPHRRRAWPPRSSASAACPASTGPALAVQMVTDAGPFVLLDIGANPDSTGREPRPVRAHGRDLRRAGPRRARPARRAALDRRGEGQGRRPDPAGDRAARRDRPQLRRQRRGQGPDPPPGRRRRVRRRPRQRRDQVLRGPVDASSSTCCGASSGGSLRGRLAYLLMRPGIAGSATSSTTSGVGGSPLLGVKGTVIITHGRAKRRMIGYAVDVARDDGPDARPGADRRGARHAAARRGRAGPRADGRAVAGGERS